eukprot:9426378-Pyramimonas_sp.AAC.1
MSPKQVRCSDTFQGSVWKVLSECVCFAVEQSRQDKGQKVNALREMQPCSSAISAQGSWEGVAVRKLA